MMGRRNLLGAGNRLLIVGKRLSLDERDGARWARGKAIAHPVAEVVAKQLRLAVDHPDRALVARFGA